MGFAVLADLKSFLNIPSSDTSNDTELGLYLNTSTEVAETAIGAATVTSYTELYGTFDGRIVLMHRPLVAITSVTPLNGVALASTAYTLDKDRNGLMINAGGANDYTVVYTAGWAAAPARAVLAQLIIGAHLWRTQRGGMVPSSLVEPEPTTMIPGVGFAIPNRAAELLASLGGPATVPGIA